MCFTMTMACAVPHSDLGFECFADKLVDPDKMDDKRTIEASCIFPRSASDTLQGVRSKHCRGLPDTCAEPFGF